MQLQTEFLKNTKSLWMMEWNTNANIADIKQLQTEDLNNTKSLCMIELNALAKFEVIMQLEGKIWPDTKSQCMIESNTLANIAAIKQLQTKVLKYTKSLCMMESNYQNEVNYMSGILHMGLPWLKKTFYGRQTFMEDNLLWKMTFDGRRAWWKKPMIEDELW